MDEQTVWALKNTREIVECEGSALVTCAHNLQIYEIEAESTLLSVAISEALLEAFSRGAASPQSKTSAIA